MSNILLTNIALSKGPEYLPGRMTSPALWRLINGRDEKLERKLTMMLNPIGNVRNAAKRNFVFENSVEVELFDLKQQKVVREMSQKRINLEKLKSHVNISPNLINRTMDTYASDYNQNTFKQRFNAFELVIQGPEAVVTTSPVSSAPAFVVGQTTPNSSAWASGPYPQPPPPQLWVPDSYALSSNPPHVFDDLPYLDTPPPMHHRPPPLYLSPHPPSGHVPVASAEVGTLRTVKLAEAATQPQPGQGPGEVLHGPSVPPKPEQLHYCEVCQLSCTGPQQYKEHLQGRKHMKKWARVPSDSVEQPGKPITSENPAVVTTNASPIVPALSPPQTTINIAQPPTYQLTKPKITKVDGGNPRFGRSWGGNAPFGRGRAAPRYHPY